MKNYDVVIIGGGSAGLTAAAYASQFGARVQLYLRSQVLCMKCVLPTNMALKLIPPK